MVHGDITHDNVMLVNHQQQPCKVKMMDFGLAFCPSNPSQVFQACGFRAPECFFSLPQTGAINMWADGCTLAFLYLCNYMFDILCDYKCMMNIVWVLGFPKVHLLRSEQTSN
ncbi:homeodomain-interacting protein kinase 1-like [Thalassophryne amazonica]|uniref:homeodomain-interacting protein kinase 1-like n=1 Tax=Thalassophryne amazonica TaxID=390379 RepID=UPI00147126F6|nr:homeodomain-interacting protein kinase 1-like [Thalassophryne amazonica]